MLENTREEPIADFPAPRTVKWCPNHLRQEGRGLESHHEHFKRLVDVKDNQWAMEEYASIIGALKSFLFVDQYDPSNSVGLEILFRRLQTIEYSYSDRLRDRTAASSGGRLTLEEQAAFGATARLESKLMVNPQLLEAARSELEKEAALAKSLVKAREARHALGKKKG